MSASLSGITIFTGMEPGALELLLRRAAELEAPAGRVVLREGETGTQFYLVRDGAVRICKAYGTPREVELARLGPGEFFGEMCILETLPRCATVLTATASTLVRLPAMAFYDLFQAMPAQYSLLLLNIARDLSRRLRRLDEIFAARH
jgi:CRP-like cAMP-binding protein